MKEYSKKEENRSRAMQPQVDGHTQGTMERVLQRFSLFQRKKDSPAGCSVVAQKQAEPTVETSVENRNGLVSSLSENRTGMPDSLKTGVEQLSGYSLDDVRVHYNSSQPAQLQALAFAQGTDIHIAPGQESSLPHEAWHVVQQKQGRVQPTLQLQGVNVNDNEYLEKEADVMGHECLRRTNIPTQLKRKKLQWLYI